MYPSYRKPSGKQAPSFASAAARAESAASFRSGAATYADVRPSYPPEIAELLGSARTIVDIGAGTGKFTATLRAPHIMALDPSADMCRELSDRLDIPVWRATAEATALADASLDAVTCAQTWHWVSTTAASAEAARITHSGGRLLLAWNTLDVDADPWVLRLTRIMHSGDIHKAGFFPEVSPPWQLQQDLRLKWSHTLTPEQLHLLMHTRSYWLRNGDKIRAKMTDNLNWYLFEHLGFSPGQEISIPYRSDAFLYTKATG